MEIPIRFQGQQQTGYQQQPQQTSSWGSQQGHQQQQPFQQHQQQQSSPWTQHQQKSGTFSSVPEQGVEQQQQHPQLPKFSQGIESQKYGQSNIESQKYGQQTSHQQQVGQVVQKEIRAENVSSVDLTTVFILLRLIGHQYVKEHAMTKLAHDNQGLLKKWHKEVTVKNLDFLCNLAKQWGMTLPFPVKPEQREQDIKQALHGAPKIITEGELLVDLCIGAHILEPVFTCGFMNGSNEELREFCRNACSTLCDNFLDIKTGLKQTDQDFCPPCVKSIVCKEGVCERR